MRVPPAAGPRTVEWTQTNIQAPDSRSKRITASSPSHCSNSSSNTSGMLPAEAGAGRRPVRAQGGRSPSRPPPSPTPPPPDGRGAGSPPPPPRLSATLRRRYGRGTDKADGFRAHDARTVRDAAAAQAGPRARRALRARRADLDLRGGAGAPPGADRRGRAALD